MAGSFVADRDLYADKDGNVVEADDPAKVTKIASKGSTVSDADVQKYGLTQGGQTEAEENADAGGDESAEESDVIDPEEESARIQGKASAKKSSKKSAK